jgi:hypothetical protein
VHWAALREAIRVSVNIGIGTDQNPAEPDAGTKAAINKREIYVAADMTPLYFMRTALMPLQMDYTAN